MNRGLTLIELSIVLVIIGLLTGGVLAGQGLIEQARIVKDAREIRSINIAYRTFVAKYGYPPGDVPNPTRFFPICNTLLWGSQGSSTEVVGNGDGYIDSNGNLSHDRHEYWCAWMNLAQSKLYEPIGPQKDFRGEDNPTQDIDFGNGDTFAQAIWPGNDRNQQIADLLDENTWIGGKKVNILMLFGNYEITGEVGFATPTMAQRLDTKVDDGKPTGVFRAYNIVGTCFSNPDGYQATVDSEFDYTEETKTCALGYSLQ